jgi:hypothetical protein
MTKEAFSKLHSIYWFRTLCTVTIHCENVQQVFLEKEPCNLQGLQQTDISGQQTSEHVPIISNLATHKMAITVHL